MATDMRSAKEWAKLVKRWERSGKPCKQFAAEGISWSTLAWWKWRLRSKAGPTAKPKKRGRRAARSAPVRMVELVGATGPRPDGAVELVVGDGVVVRVRRGFDAEALRQVVALFTVADRPSC